MYIKLLKLSHNAVFFHQKNLSMFLNHLNSAPFPTPHHLSLIKFSLFRSSKQSHEVIIMVILIFILIYSKNRFTLSPPFETIFIAGAPGTHKIRIKHHHHIKACPHPAGAQDVRMRDISTILKCIILFFVTLLSAREDNKREMKQSQQ